MIMYLYGFVSLHSSLFVQACVVPYVLGAMSRHSHHAALQAEACFCLRSIKLSNHGDRQIVRYGGLMLVFLALHNHRKDVLVQTRASA